MDWNAIIQVAVTVASILTTMWALLKFILRDIRIDLSNIKSDIKDLKLSNLRHESRIDHLYEENNRLYKVLMEIVKK